MKAFSSILGRVRGIALFLSALGAFVSTGLVVTAPGPIAIGTVAAISTLATPTDAKAALSFVTSLRQARCQAIVTAAGANAVVVAAGGADVLVLLQVGLVQHRFTTGALDPQAFRDTAAVGRVGLLNFWG